MKALLCIACLFIPSILFSQDSLSQAVGPNGGIVKKAENYYIEIKNVPEMSFYAYLLDKELKIISNKGVLCNAEFFFPDNTSLKVPLKPAPGEAFTADVASGYDACEITFYVLDKHVFARFKNISSIVQKK